MNAADLLISELKGRGVDRVYTLCGNGLDPILDAGHRGGMRFIDTRNEQAAAYMADAAGRLTRRIGVAAVSSGVAHINALTGVCNAWFDGSPMLLITGASDSRYRGRGNFQDMETAAMAKPLCKYSGYVDRPDRLVSMLEEAIGSAVGGRPGPAHLTIPADVLSAEMTTAPDRAERPRSSAVKPEATAGKRSLEEAARLIRRADSPLIIAGSGVFYADGASSLESLAATVKAPVMVPIWDRGAVERPFPGYCGVLGAASGSTDILTGADCILLIGAEVDYRVGYLDESAVAPGAKFIRIEADPGVMYRGIHPDVSLPGNPACVIEQLLEVLRDSRFVGNGEWLADAIRRRDTFYEPFVTGHRSPGGSNRVTGRDVVEEMGEAITDDTFMLVDGGNIGQWFHMLMNDRYPSRWLTCGRSAVVGWGFPSAAAVSSLNPGGRVLLLSGDGASTFTIAEIETAVRQNLPYVAVIADDSAWGIVVSGSEKRGQPAVASKLGPVRFDEVARGFGARGIRLDDIKNLKTEIENGFSSNQVTIIHVPVLSGGPAD